MPNIMVQHKIVQEVKTHVKYVACYVRVSTEEQVKYGFSIEAQKDALEKYCREHGYKFDFYIDEGVSASSMKKRKALLRMLSKANIYDMVLFTKLDRLSRNVLDANNINKTLQENNCPMKAIDEDDIDTSTADGLFMFNLKVSLAQREIGKTSERIRFVFDNKREKGEVTSGTKKYGYDIVDKKFVINEKEALNIINLYKYYIKTNGSVAETYKYFIKHFPSKGQDAMYIYLRDTAYIGKYKLFRKEVYLDNYIPRIMSDDLFYSVQRLHKQSSPSQSESSIEGIFSGLVFCNKCLHRMSKMQDNRGKNIVFRYGCFNAYTRKAGIDEYKCSNSKSIREETIENYLLDNIKKLASQYIKREFVIVNKPQQDNSKKITNIKNKMEKLKDLYLNDLIDKTMYETDFKKLKAELKALEESNMLQETKDYSKLEKLINSDIISIYNSLDRIEKRTFWLSVISTIVVENGEIKEVTFL